MPSRRAAGWAAMALLWGIAAAYFLLGVGEGIEGVDEGHLVYFGWRTAEGALPYRDFQHWYGPSVFFLNGLLLRLFAPDLLVVRLALVALRAALAVAVYLLARAVAGRGPALLAYALTVAVSGAPLWVFTTPYASNYQLPLVLGALAAFVLLPARPRARLYLAGACLGLAATFKPTGGILPLAGFAVFLLARPAPPAAAGEPAAPAWRALAVAALAGVLGVLAALGAAMGDAWTVAVLLPPIALLALRALARVRRAPPSALASNLADVARLALGGALAPAAFAAGYAAHGELAALAWSTLFGLPRLFTFFVPYPLPDREGLLILGLAAASLAALGAGRAGSPLAAAVRPLAALAALALAAAAVVPGPLGAAGWLGAALRLWFWLPPVVVWAASLALARAPDADPPEAVAVVALVTSALLPLLAPVADWPHLLLALPAFLPLAAWGLRAAMTGPAPARPWARALLALWLLAASGPFVAMLATARLRPAAAPAAYERATGIADRRPAAADAHAVVRHLRARLAPGDRVLVVPSEAMIYFLAGRRSALERDEFFFYAATAGPQLAAADARRFVDQAEAIRRLDAERPPVVRGRGPAAAAFAAVFPDLAAYLERAYRPVVDFGAYEVLEWRPVDAAQGSPDHGPREARR